MQSWRMWRTLKQADGFKALAFSSLALFVIMAACLYILHLTGKAIFTEQNAREKALYELRSGELKPCTKPEQK